MTAKTLCRTCKHFRRTKDAQEAGVAGWRECRMATLPDGPEETLAFAIDQHDFGPDLFVSPDFGCIQHTVG